MIATLGIYRRLLGVQVRSQMQYPVAFAFDLVATALITVLEFGSLALVMQRFGSLRGWSLPEVAFLYGLADAAFGIMDMVFSGFDPQDFGQRVRRGTFDQVLLRPVSVTIQVLGSRFMMRRLGRIAQGGAIFGVALVIADVTWSPAKLAYLPLVIGGMVLFFGGLFMIGSAITFWTIESIEVMNIFTYGGKELISYPMSIYPEWMRRFFTFVVPAIFLNYYPALYFLDKPDPLGMPYVARFVAPLAGLFVFLFARWFWHYGIRHYQSTGT